MEKNGTRPRTDFSKLAHVIEQLHDYAGGGEPPSREDAETAVKYLEWLDEMLEDRRSYHKLQQMKRKEFERLAKQMMSKDEIAEVERQVKSKLTGPSPEEEE